MIGEEQRIVLVQIRLNTVPKLRRPRRAERHKRHGPDEDDKFRQHKSIQSGSRDGKPRGHGGMGMDDGADVRPVPKDAQV